MAYPVLTTRYHYGFVLWPSSYGSFSAKNYMGGLNLVKDIVAACKEFGLKVRLYYSGGDLQENKEYPNLMLWSSWLQRKPIHLAGGQYATSANI